MPKHKAPEISSKLRERIANGEWSAEKAMPNERALALEFGVARNTIRNAFAMLETEGLISRHVGRGTIVKEKPSDELVGILEKISGASPLDILNLRLMVEPQVAALAAIHASVSDLEHIVTADTQATQCHDLETFEKWDNEFHFRIYAATRNEFLIDLWRILAIIRHREPMGEIRRRTFGEDVRLVYCLQHASIIASLSARDAEGASAAMRTHLSARRKNYFGE